MKNACLAFAAALACSTALWAQNKEGKVDGHENTYVLSVPPDYKPGKKWPLLILLHGSGDRAKNFIQSWQTPDIKNNFIVCALNSKVASQWETTEEKVVMDLAKQLSKEYSIEPTQLWLGGFSAGGFMTAYTGIKNYKSFAGLIVIGAGEGNAAGIKEFKPAALEKYFYMLVGSQDPNEKSMKSFDKDLETAGCKQKKFVEVPNMGHTFRQEHVQDIGKWLLDTMKKVTASSPVKQKELQKSLDDAAKLVTKKEFLQAIALYQKVIEETGQDSGWGKKAAKAMADIAKKADDMLKKAEEHIAKKEFDTAKQVLDEVIEKFKDTEWARKAEDLRKKCE